MSNRRTNSNGSNMIAAERRRTIYEWARRRGSVSVSDLASTLGVAENTVRYDLDVLAREGKLVRSHGGAVIKEAGLPVPPYPQIRDANMAQKSLIADAAVDFIPETGLVFINAGSTTYQLVLRLQERHRIQITTNSPEIAVYLSSNTSVDTEIVGGRMIRDSLETDGTLSPEVLSKVYWDTAFMGISAIDLEHGITSINLTCAMLEGKVMEHSRKVVGLCDSSKLGRFAHAQVGPVTMIDTLITDKNIKPAMVEAMEGQGIQVIIAGSETRE